MEFFVEKVLEEATDTTMARVKVPGMDTALEAVSDLRDQYRQDGSEGRMGEWRHVASIKAPVLEVAEILDPEFLNRNGKREFYAWLDNHREWCTYDRRNQRRRNQSIFMDGKEIT